MSWRDNDLQTQNNAEIGLENSYLVLTGQITLEELFIKHPYQGMSIMKKI